MWWQHPGYATIRHGIQLSLVQPEPEPPRQRRHSRGAELHGEPLREPYGQADMDNGDRASLQQQLHARAQLHGAGAEYVPAAGHGILLLVSFRKEDILVPSRGIGCKGPGLRAPEWDHTPAETVVVLVPLLREPQRREIDAGQGFCTTTRRGSILSITLSPCCL